MRFMYPPEAFLHHAFVANFLAPLVPHPGGEFRIASTALVFGRVKRNVGLAEQVPAAIS